MNYKEYLRSELVPAFGCTEPIAIAFTAAKASEVLGQAPERFLAKLSGNIIKNAHSVNVPGTLGRKGIEISVAAGGLLGDASKGLEVLASIDKSQLDACDRFIEEKRIVTELKPDVANLYIEIRAEKGQESATVIVQGGHTNIVEIRKNDELIFENLLEQSEEAKVDFSFDKIYRFASEEDYADIKDIFSRQIEYNMAIAEEGLKNDWGSNIGSLILETSPNNIQEKMAAYASAGSDARMSGAENPVVINSGSGNQGITVSVPIIVYAQENPKDEDTLYRALIFANLIGLYMKQGIGKLSAYCGAVSAASASIAGIAFYNQEPQETIALTLSNALAGNSGIICDGAKASCAMKIASSIRNAWLAYQQAKTGNSFNPGDGIVMDDIDQTIRTVSNIARYGMKSTDEVILNEMIGQEYQE